MVRKGEWQPGDLGVYFPPDTLLPTKWTDEFGVTKYCQPQPGDKQRIRCAKLRGEPSFGLLMPAARYADGIPVDYDVAARFGVEKYYPPVRTTAGDAEADHPLFVKYTEIENLRNYPDVFLPDEYVIITEKLDGTNCRVGVIEGQAMAGSHRLRRKHPATPEAMSANTYWFPWTLPSVLGLLNDLAREHQQVILFGEVYGPGIQKNPIKVKQLSFRAFDLLVDDRYLDYPKFLETCAQYEISVVPVLSSCGYSLEQVRSLASGATYTGQGKREGVVVHPVAERVDPRIGRVALKYINDEVLLDLQREDTTDI